MGWLVRCAVAILVSLAAGSAVAGAALSGGVRADVVQDLAAAMRDRYALPDAGAQAAGRITSRLKDGAYDHLDEPGAFAQRLTADLRSVAPDQHLGVQADAARTSVYGPAEPPDSEAGVVRADELDNGIGYLEVASFPPVDRFRPVVDKAMGALAGSRAVIVDLRRNTGGDPAAVSYLVSYFVPPDERVYINDIVARRPGTSTLVRQAYFSSPTSPNFAGKPVLVLTSAATFSGGEEFAYDVQSLKIGTIVGEITRGGANPTASVRLRHGFTAFVPYARAENPVTKTNWDGRGVSPDISAAASDALGVGIRRLGGRRETTIERASRRQVFAPRKEPVRGAAATLQRLLAEVVLGAPDYAAMTAHGASQTREALPRMRQVLSDLGPLKSLQFREVDAFGGDVFEAVFQNGAANCAIALSEDGKVDAWTIVSR